MAQQSSGEFASTDPTTRAQDARVQERGIRAKISLSACSNTKYLQRPASSDLSKNAPSLQGIGPADVARSCRRGVSPTCQQNFLGAQFGNVTKPAKQLGNVSQACRRSWRRLSRPIAPRWRNGPAKPRHTGMTSRNKTWLDALLC